MREATPAGLTACLDIIRLLPDFFTPDVPDTVRWEFDEHTCWGWGGDHVSSPYDTGRFAEVDGLDQVASHVDAARVVSEMLGDLRTHPNDWENPTLERFLDALAASLEALSGNYEQFSAQPSWKLFAEVLVKASGYE